MPVRIVEIWYSHQNDVLFRYEGEQTIYKAAPHRIKYFEDQKIIKADGTIDPRYARKNMAKTIDLSDEPRPKSRVPRILIQIGIGMIICLIGLVVGSSIVATLFHHGAGDRTYAAHYVAAVGHGSRNSTFIISYVGLNPVIIEFPEGQNSEEYRLPLLVNDASDFTLSFRDVNHDHKVDMIVTVDKVDYVYLNDGKKFVFQKLGI